MNKLHFAYETGIKHNLSLRIIKITHKKKKKFTNQSRGCCDPGTSGGADRKFHFSTTRVDENRRTHGRLGSGTWIDEI